MRLVTICAVTEFVCAWFLMLAAGVAHDDWWHQVPPLGYATAVTLAGLPLAAFTLILAAVILVLRSRL